MEITRAAKGDVTIFSISGEVTSANSSKVSEAFTACVDEGQKRVVVDLALLDYIDSSGLAALLILLARLRPIGGTVRLCSIQEKVKYPFRTARLDALFSIFDSLDEALKDFGS